MRFDSGPEVFVRVNRNYVLTEYVLNENDCNWEDNINNDNKYKIRQHLLEGSVNLPWIKHAHKLKATCNELTFLQKGLL